MYIDRTEQLRKELRHLIYDDPNKLARMIQDLTDKIAMMSDKLEVLTDLYGDSLAFHRHLREGRFCSRKLDLVELYINQR